MLVTTPAARVRLKRAIRRRLRAKGLSALMPAVEHLQPETLWAVLRQLALLGAFFVVRPGYALPPCTARHDGDVAEFEGDRYVCEAVLGQWVKQGGGK